MISKRQRYAWLACLVILAIGMASALADGWPTRVVTLVIPFGPGSGTDIVGRILANRVSQALGQQMIVEDLGGAGGTIAVSRVAKATPDGYQIVLGAVDTFAQSQYLFKEPPSNTVVDFVPVGLAVEQPLLLVVRNDLPVANLKEFATYLKANQTKMRFGSAGIGAAPYLACAMITAAIGATATHVPYRSAAPALQDMIRGDIDYYCPLSISVSSLIESKSVKPLAVLTGDRSPLFSRSADRARTGLRCRRRLLLDGHVRAEGYARIGGGNAQCRARQRFERFRHAISFAGCIGHGCCTGAAVERLPQRLSPKRDREMDRDHEGKQGASRVAFSYAAGGRSY